MAATQNIQKHFNSLRADTGRRKGRPDPWATGFEDDSDEDRPSRAKTKALPVGKPANSTRPRNDSYPISPLDTSRASIASTSTSGSVGDAVAVSLSPPPQRTSNRHASPAPSSLPTSRVSDGAGLRSDSKAASLRKSSASLPVGNPVSAGDSEDDNFSNFSRSGRGLSPAPRHNSDASKDSASRERSSTPSGLGRDSNGNPRKSSVVPRHTVASAFAGTKYLQDSDSEEEAASSRKNSEEVAAADESSDEDIDNLLGLGLLSSRPPVKKKHLEVQRVDKPKTQSGGGVSWRAFSAGRLEQRTAELEALQASLRKRGKSITFGTHAVTDEGRKIPLAASPENPFGGRGPNASSRPRRSRSPPRRAEDVKPPAEEEAGDDADERGGSIGSGSSLGLYDPTEFKTNPFTGEPVRRISTNDSTSSAGDRQRGGAGASPQQLARSPSPRSTGRQDSPSSPIPDIRILPAGIPQ